MAEVLRVVGRVTTDDQARQLAAASARMRARGLASMILCGSGAPAIEAFGGGPTIEAPAIARAWLRPWAARWVVTGRPGLVHLLDPDLAAIGPALADRWKVPYLISFDEFPAADARLRLAGRWCRGVVAAEEDLAVELRVAWRLPSELVTAIAPGVEPVEPSPAPAPIGPGSGRLPVVGMAGRPGPDSGAAVFLEAARRVVAAGVDAEFLVAGEGRGPDDPRRLAGSLGLAGRVTFVDDPGLVGTFWRVLDVYCQPDLRPTTGRRLVEAMARGVATVCSDVPGLRGTRGRGDRGPTVPPGDPEALAAAILGLLADRPRAVEVAARGREWVRLAHDPDREADELAALYRRAIAEG